MALGKMWLQPGQVVQQVKKYKSEKNMCIMQFLESQYFEYFETSIVCMFELGQVFIQTVETVALQFVCGCNLLIYVFL